MTSCPFALKISGPCAPEKWSTKFEKGKYFSYKGTKFFKMISDFMAIGGDVVSNDGKGGMSKYGPTFKDENTYKVKADEKGLVGLYNNGPNTNSSQFFFTYVDCSWINGKYNIIGKIVEGLDILGELEKGKCLSVKVQIVSQENGLPKQVVKVVDCGQI